MPLGLFLYLCTNPEISIIFYDELLVFKEQESPPAECVNARGIPLAVEQVLALLLCPPRASTRSADLPPGGEGGYPHPVQTLVYPMS